MNKLIFTLLLAGFTNTQIHSMNSPRQMQQLLTLALEQHKTLEEKNTILDQLLTNALHQLSMYEETNKLLIQKNHEQNVLIDYLKTELATCKAVKIKEQK